MNQEVERAAKLVWDYMKLDQSPQKADCLLVLGSGDLRVAERAVELYEAKLAPMMVMSGSFGRMTKDVWHETEAKKFADVALARGVPVKDILLEDKATNTKDNFRLSEQLLSQHGLAPESFIIVTKPYMERRALATFEIVLPGKTAMATSPQLDFASYAAGLPDDSFIDVMVGDLERIKVYGDKGWLTKQTIPAEVWQAQQRLIKLGYDKQLLS